MQIPLQLFRQVTMFNLTDDIESRLERVFTLDGSRALEIIVIGVNGVGVKTVVALLKDIIGNFLKSVKRIVTVPPVLEISGHTSVPVCSNNDILIFLYDVCDDKSFTAIQSMLQDVKNNSNLILVGNKIDMHYWRKVELKKAMEVASLVKANYVEISTLSGQHMDFLIDCIFRKGFDLFRNQAHMSKITDWIEDQKLEAVAKQVAKLESLSVNMRDEIYEQSMFLGSTAYKIDSSELFKGKSALKMKSKQSEKVIEMKESNMMLEGSLGSVRSRSGDEFKKKKRSVEVVEDFQVQLKTKGTPMQDNVDFFAPTNTSTLAGTTVLDGAVPISTMQKLGPAPAPMTAPAPFVSAPPVAPPPPTAVKTTYKPMMVRPAPLDSPLGSGPPAGVASGGLVSQITHG